MGRWFPRLIRTLSPAVFASLLNNRHGRWKSMPNTTILLCRASSVCCLSQEWKRQYLIRDANGLLLMPKVGDLVCPTTASLHFSSELLLSASALCSAHHLPGIIIITTQSQAVLACLPTSSPASATVRLHTAATISRLSLPFHISTSGP